MYFDGYGVIRHGIEDALPVGFEVGEKHHPRDRAAPGWGVRRSEDHAIVRVGGNGFADDFLVKMKDHFLAANCQGGHPGQNEKAEAQAAEADSHDSRCWGTAASCSFQAAHGSRGRGKFRLLNSHALQHGDK